jgi:adenylate cyclase
VQAGALAGDAVVQPDDDFVVRRASAGPGSLPMHVAQQAAGGAADGAALAPLEYIAYRGPRGTFDTRSYYQAVLPGLLPPGFFRGKIVLVGRSARTATELQAAQADLFNAPFATTGGERLMPGVELQATQVDNLLAPERLRTAPGAWSAALVAGLLLALVWAGARWHPGAAAALAGTLALGTGLLSWALFTGPRLWLPPLLPMVVAVAMYGATALVGYARARRRAREVRAMFAQYVPPEVVARLVARPDLLRLGGESREVTLLFTDLANFTTLSEQLSAEQTVEVLTGYFNAMTPLIHRTGGTVDKFIGDAVMAFWGAPLDDPGHAAHAVEAAIAMQRAMERLVAGLRARGLPPIHMRIGLHSGRVVVGNVGSEQRFSYTAIGDAVNLAARLEGANKAFGTGILLSEATAARLPSRDGLRALDDVIVKGKTEPVRVYTPCADAALCALSAQALAAFNARRWDEAEARLWDLLAALPGDLAAQRLLHRVEAARALPPDAPWTAAVALDKL